MGANSVEDSFSSRWYEINVVRRFEVDAGILTASGVVGPVRRHMDIIHIQPGLAN